MLMLWHRVSLLGCQSRSRSSISKGLVGACLVLPPYLPLLLLETLPCLTCVCMHRGTITIHWLPILHLHPSAYLTDIYYYFYFYFSVCTRTDLFCIYILRQTCALPCLTLPTSPTTPLIRTSSPSVHLGSLPQLFRDRNSIVASLTHLYLTLHLLPLEAFCLSSHPSSSVCNVPQTPPNPICGCH